MLITPPGDRREAGVLEGKPLFRRSEPLESTAASGMGYTGPIGYQMSRERLFRGSSQNRREPT
jgi:hypothetical protein